MSLAGSRHSAITKPVNNVTDKSQIKNVVNVPQVNFGFNMIRNGIYNVVNYQ